jgi:hypothetical protein
MQNPPRAVGEQRREKDRKLLGPVENAFPFCSIADVTGVTGVTPGFFGVTDEIWLRLEGVTPGRDADMYDKSGWLAVSGRPSL